MEAEVPYWKDTRLGRLNWIIVWMGDLCLEGGDVFGCHLMKSSSSFDYICSNA